MKRTLERSAFMLIGALIASIAYFVGNADRGAQAQDGITRFDKIECSELWVDGRSQDGTLGTTMITTVNGEPRLLMSRLKAGTEKIQLSVTDNFASIAIAHTESRSGARSGAGIGIVLVSSPGGSRIQVEDEVVFNKVR